MAKTATPVRFTESFLLELLAGNPTTLVIVNPANFKVLGVTFDPDAAEALQDHYRKAWNYSSTVMPLADLLGS